MQGVLSVCPFFILYFLVFPSIIGIVNAKLYCIFVAIGRYRWLAWAIAVGIGVLYLWFTVGGLRSPSNRVPLWVIRARQVAILTVARGVGLSWCFMGSRRD